MRNILNSKHFLLVCWYYRTGALYSLTRAVTCVLLQSIVLVSRYSGANTLSLINIFNIYEKVIPFTTYYYLQGKIIWLLESISYVRYIIMVLGIMEIDAVINLSWMYDMVLAVKQSNTNSHKS